jgi:hypothetical protein
MNGISAGASVTPEEDRFSIDPNAGFKGSFSGLQSGGAIGAITGGITAQAGTFSRVNKNLQAYNPSIDGYQMDPYGRPVYNSGAFTQANRDLGELNEGQRKINRSVDPATHAFAEVFGTERKLRDKADLTKMSVMSEQKAFNRINNNYQRQQLARRNYEDQISNIYGIPRGYY